MSEEVVQLLVGGGIGLGTALITQYVASVGESRRAAAEAERRAQERVEDRNDARAREVRAHQREAYTNILTCLSSLTSVAQQVQVNISYEGHYPEGAALWPSNYQLAIGLAKQVEDLSTKFASKEVMTAALFIALATSCLDPDDDGTRHSYIEILGNQSYISLSPDGAGWGVIGENYQSTCQVLNRVLRWTIAQMRYETGVEPEPPAALPFSLSLQLSWRNGGPRQTEAPT